jgi:AraC family transcriptional activator of pobA
MDMAGPTHYLDDSTVSTEFFMHRAAATFPVPRFYLYGEPQRLVAEGFVHVESLDDRSRPSEWTIRSHVHKDLNHIILIAQGGGSMRAEDATVTFDAPCLLLVPAGIVHGFAWHSESRGQVMTIAESYLRHLSGRDPDLAPLFRHAHMIALVEDDRAMIEETLAQMSRELGWIGRGQRAAVEAGLLSVLVRALRRLPLGDRKEPGRGQRANLVARLRERIDQRFRLREPVEVHAKALGVSQTALRVACARVAGSAPAVMLDERALLEARRLLLYTNLSVAEIAYSVGFEDPAYFSRFFTRHVGRPPRTYRAGRREGTGN